MDGAYGPSIADMDGDGDLDIVTVAEFAFWDRPDTPKCCLVGTTRKYAICPSNYSDKSNTFGDM